MLESILGLGATGGLASTLGLSSLGSSISGLLGSDFLGGLGIAGASSLGNLLSGNYLGNKTRSDQARLSYEMANYTAHLQHKYKQIYDQENYELARNYAENSAKWAVTGLKNAGLNPILAASSGFNVNMGSAGSSPSVSGDASLSPNPSGMDIAEALRDIASLDVSRASAKQLATQSSVNRANTDLIKANSAKVGAEIDKIYADIDRVKRMTDVEVKSQKLQNKIAKTQVEFLPITAGGQMSVTNPHAIAGLIRKGVTDTSSSAKDAAQQLGAFFGDIDLSRTMENRSSVNNPPVLRVLNTSPLSNTAKRLFWRTLKNRFRNGVRRAVKSYDFRPFYMD